MEHQTESTMPLYFQGQWIDVTEDVYRAYNQKRERVKYLIKKERKHPLFVVIRLLHSVARTFAQFPFHTARGQGDPNINAGERDTILKPAYISKHLAVSYYGIVTSSISCKNRKRVQHYSEALFFCISLGFGGRIVEETIGGFCWHHQFTDVLVNDPTTGYGIFIENMLEAAA